MPFQADVRQHSDHFYEVVTDAPIQFINKIGLEIFTKWVEFAVGASSLNGRMIMNPTGKLARSISWKKEPKSIAIIQDETEAPEGGILETGHGPIDLKQKYRGRTFPIHRPGGTPFLKGKRVPGYYWTASRGGDHAGFATVGDTGWVIPPMQAYHSAMTLARLAAEKLKSA